MDIATARCIQPQSQIINRYRLYLQVISLYDIITYDGHTIHPNIMRGERILSRHSSIYWVDFRHPPKKHLVIWQIFLKEHIILLIDHMTIQWYPHIKPNFTHTFSHSTHDNLFYQSMPEGYLVYSPKKQPASTNVPTYHTHTMLSFPDQNILSSLQAVDVSHEPKQIKILGQTDINTHGIQDTTNNSYKRKPPLTLLYTFTEITKAQIHWVGSHQDKDTPWNNITDLLDLKLSPEATMSYVTKWPWKPAYLTTQIPMSMSCQQKNGHYLLALP